MRKEIVLYNPGNSKPLRITFTPGRGWQISQGGITIFPEAELSQAIKLWNRKALNELDRLPIIDGELKETPVALIAGYDKALIAWSVHFWEGKPSPEPQADPLQNLLETAERMFGPVNQTKTIGASKEITEELQRMGWLEHSEGGIFKCLPPTILGPGFRLLIESCVKRDDLEGLKTLTAFAENLG